MKLTVSSAEGSIALNSGCPILLLALNGILALLQSPFLNHSVIDYSILPSTLIDSLSTSSVKSLELKNTQ